jgi:mannose-1-phosphate guanylyltransferase/mannose-6-phosphate isomerase
MIIPVILAGGSGTRLWPLSRSAYPKQFLSLVSDQTLFQETVLRAQSIPDSAPPFVICHQEHRFLVAEQLKQLGIKNAIIILEPVSKNTAPAAAIAALYYLHHSDNPELLILPADHVIQDNHSFINAVNQGKVKACADWIVTFGVKPLHPEIGYGYIKVTNEFKVEKFVEKPDLKTAEMYLASQQYYWNSGIFMFRASCFIRELEKYAPDILKNCQQVMSAITNDLDFVRLDKKIMETCPSNSIDYAVMEHTRHAVLVPLDAEWSDAGSWASLWEAQQTDPNASIVQGDIITENVNHCYLRAESRLLAVLGVSDHIVIETPDAVLVAHKNYSQLVKNIVDRLKQQHRIEAESQLKVYRPWGSYEIIDRGDCFQVKRITVNKGASLSLQSHQHRSEHWILLHGIAEITRGEEKFLVTANQSTYIPQGVKHRLVNIGDASLEMIEVQTGNYLGEDDIVRFEDIYGRTFDEM